MFRLLLDRADPNLSEHGRTILHTALNHGCGSVSFLSCLWQMQKWEYKVFASHLDPAELVLILDSSGRDGWELVAVVSVTDEVPADLLNPVELPKGSSLELGAAKPTQAFRYIFKRALN